MRLHSLFNEADDRGRELERLASDDPSAFLELVNHRYRAGEIPTVVAFSELVRDHGSLSESFILKLARRASDELIRISGDELINTNSIMVNMSHMVRSILNNIFDDKGEFMAVNSHGNKNSTAWSRWIDHLDESGHRAIAKHLVSIQDVLRGFLRPLDRNMKFNYLKNFLTDFEFDVDELVSLLNGEGA